jgi:hypothetical protein
LSHVAVLQLRVRDLDALEAAAPAVGLKLNRGQKTWRWVGRWYRDYHEADAAYKNGIRPEDYGKGDHALSLVDCPGAFEVGLVPAPDGDGYLLGWDFVDGRLLEAIGRHGERLQAAYGREVLRKRAAQIGAVLSEEVDAEGNVHVYARRDARLEA